MIIVLITHNVSLCLKARVISKEAGVIRNLLSAKSHEIKSNDNATGSHPVFPADYYYPKSIGHDLRESCYIRYGRLYL